MVSAGDSHGLGQRSLALAVTLLINDNMLFNPAVIATPDTHWFDPHYWLSQGKSRLTQGGRGNVLFIEDEKKQWVLRHYRRGGLVGKLIHDQYLWRGAEATRAFVELRLLNELRELQLPVPNPVAARYVRSGLGYRADLLTAAIPNARTFAQCLTGGRLSYEVWQAVGATLARFHAAGVHHADLNAGNILVDSQQRVWLLDFDRGRIHSHVDDRSWVRMVMARLLRSLNKLRERKGLRFEMSEWKVLVRAHEEELKSRQR